MRLYEAMRVKVGKVEKVGKAGKIGKVGKVWAKTCPLASSSLLLALVSPVVSRACGGWVDGGGVR